MNVVGVVEKKRDNDEFDVEDVSSSEEHVRLEGGDRISVLKHWKAGGKKAEFLRAVHSGACGYFRVALSPNFNAAHKDHFHFDRGSLWTCR